VSQDSTSLIVGKDSERRKAMSGTGLTAVLLMIGTVMLLMCYWKQIAIFLLFVAVTVFCFGIYFIVSTIGLYLP
jgi:hypothetical protein